MSNPIKPTSRAGLGIVNRHGEFWTPEVFETAEDAEAFCRSHYLSMFFGWSDYRLVPARVTIEEISE